MDVGTVGSENKRKRNLKVIFVAFIILLVFFTFFSNTLQSMILPKVATEQPVKGHLEFTLEESGTLKPLSQISLSHPEGLKVAKILVKEGDHVKKGQQLILYDTQDAKRELQDEITSLMKQKLDLQGLHDQYIETYAEEDELKLESAKRDIEKSQLDIASQERKINGLQKQIASKQSLAAPMSGRITKVNAVQGFSSSGEPDAVLTNNSLGYEMSITVDARLLSIMGLVVKQSVDVEITPLDGQKVRKIKGVITEVSSAEPGLSDAAGDPSGEGAAGSIPRKTLKLKVLDERLKGGEQGEIQIKQPSSKEGWIISKSAIHQDRDGMYIYVIDQQLGPLGNHFSARKVPISYSETNGSTIMVQSESLYEDSKIITGSSEPLQDGNKIRLE